MKILLRPHHLLCLKGYKGLNYSKSSIKNWNSISNYLEKYPETDILIVNAKDDLCKKCPAAKFNLKSRCISYSVNNIDNKVKDLLQISENCMYKFSEIKTKLIKVITAQKQEELCHDCAWWKKGLCRDSFK